MLKAIDAVAATMTGMLKGARWKGPGSKLSRKSMRNIMGAASAYEQSDSLTTGLATPMYSDSQAAGRHHRQVIIGKGFCTMVIAGALDRSAHVFGHVLKRDDDM